MVWGAQNATSRRRDSRGGYHVTRSGETRRATPPQETVRATPSDYIDQPCCSVQSRTMEKTKMMNHTNEVIAETPKSEFEKISDAMSRAEGVFSRIAELAGELIGHAPMPASATKEPCGTIGHLSMRADLLADYATQIHGEIDRIFRATRL